jgi:TusA-related sulfurtransferase
MIEIDARGLRCPQPIIELGKKISTMNTGDEVTLLSDDPATDPDLSAWSRMTGNTYKKISESVFLVTKLSER